MRCEQCEIDIESSLELCPICQAPLGSAAPPDLNDCASVARHVIGRIRRATVDEVALDADLFRADAVLALAGALPADLTLAEAETARLIDGVRPVARIRKKSGVTSAELRNALRALHERRLLRLVGIVEEAGRAAAADHVDEDATRRVLDSEMMISARAMAEIKAMIDEDKSMLDGDDTESIDIKTTPEALPFPSDD